MSDLEEYCAFVTFEELMNLYPNYNTEELSGLHDDKFFVRFVPCFNEETVIDEIPSLGIDQNDSYLYNAVCPDEPPFTDWVL